MGAARPRIFISSTFYDLKQVRASLEVFVRELGYDPIVADNIAYLPDRALDESCYAETNRRFNLTAFGPSPAPRRGHGPLHRNLDP